MIDRDLQRATTRLAATSDSPRLDAELLMAAALGIGRDKLLLDPPPTKAPPEFADMIERRAAGEPVAYITGHRAFWTIELEVGPGALIPRPDSETLITEAMAHFGERAPQRILDLGTGPGTLLLAALDQWPRATGLGVDASENALSYAQRNAARLGMGDRAVLQAGDWAEGIEERFDLILVNPPYIAIGDPDLARDVAAFEPEEALLAGDDGLADYRRIVPELPRLIAPGGIALVEIGHRQGEAVCALFRAAGLDPRLAQDLAGRDRVVSATGA